jgi:hypothetical protein
MRREEGDRQGPTLSKLPALYGSAGGAPNQTSKLAIGQHEKIRKIVRIFSTDLTAQFSDGLPRVAI